MYLSLDKPESKQVHQLYTMPQAFAAARKDQPMPSGTVFTVVRYAARLDGATPSKGGGAIRERRASGLRTDGESHGLGQRIPGHAAQWRMGISRIHSGKEAK